jgi:hypothetical protein
MYQSLSLGTGGLAVGTWSNQAPGNILATGNITANGTVYANGYAVCQSNGTNCPSGGGGNVVDTLNATLGAGSDAGGRSISNLGNVGIGTNYPSAKLDVVTGSGSALFEGDSGILSIIDGSRISTTRDTFNLTYDAARVFNVNNGQMTVSSGGAGYIKGGWTNGSDRRLKENITYFNGINGLDKILQLKPVKFDYINGEKNQLGFIAQDVQPVIPEAVVVTNKTTGMLGLKTDFIIPYLVQAIKEISATINTLTTRVDDLFKKYLGHEDRIQALEKQSLEQQKQIDDLKNQIQAIKNK